MAEAPLIEEDEYAKFYKIDKWVIKFEGGVNEIQHIQWSLIEIICGVRWLDSWGEVTRVLQTWAREERRPLENPNSNPSSEQL